MEQENYQSSEREPRRSMSSLSYGRTNSSSAGSSIRRHSFRLSGVHPESHYQIEDASAAIDDSEAVSEAGDIGDREIHSWRKSGSFSIRSTSDHSVLEKGGVAFPVTDDALLQQPNGFWSRDLAALNNDNVSPVSPLPEEIISPLSTHPILDSNHKHVIIREEPKKILPLWMEYLTCLIHLAFFGILGVLTRYLLQKLFGPNVIGATSDSAILYLDLPSNMVGSFLMGWWGVVFKGDIAQVSDYLAIGLSTGYLGSVTTFSGWNQKMLELSLHGKWALPVLGFLIGLFLAAYSIIVGVETAKGFRWLIHDKIDAGLNNSGSGCRVNKNNYTRNLAAMLVLFLMTCFLWGISGALLEHEFNDGGSGPELWLGCIVGPFGVWIRWFLARLNGRGIGKAGLLKWVPFGTLIANVSAACVMAALSTTKKAVNTETCDTITTGIQLGLLGCLSTVSTFIAEFNAMRESKHPWRAYAYALTTILLSFGLGLLIYNLPVWTQGY